MPKRPKHIFTALAACAVLGLFTAAADKDFKIGQNIEILVNLFRDLNVFYVDDVDADKMMQDAAAGMVRSLDPYTEFLPAEKMTDFELMTTREASGCSASHWIPETYCCTLWRNAAQSSLALDASVFSRCCSAAYPSVLKMLRKISMRSFVFACSRRRNSPWAIMAI